MDTYTVIAVWDDDASQLIVAGVLLGEHSPVDSDSGETVWYTRFAESVQASSWQDAVESIRAKYEG